MKRMVVLLSLVGLLLGCGAVTEGWLRRYTDGLQSQMEALSRAAAAGEDVGCEVRAVLSDWEACQKWLGAAVHEDRLDQLESHVKRAEMLSGFPGSASCRRELVLELLEVGDAAGELWEKERLSLQNIF